MRKILGCFIIIMIMITSQIFAATYYVDATNGSDSNSGTSPEIAWKTINKVNNYYFISGDSILFKRGEIWREQLIVPSSGSSGSPITFGAYYSGNDPIINGSDLITGWTYHFGNQWKAVCNIEPKQIFFDGVKGNNQISLGNVDSDKDWYWNSNILYIYYTEDPDGAVTIEASARTRCVYINSKDYITLDGLHFKYGKSSQISIDNANAFIIDNCISEYSYGGGMQVWGSSATTTIGTIKNSTFNNNDSTGIFIGYDIDSSGPTHITIENNSIHDNGTIATNDHGIYLSETCNSIIRYNKIYDNSVGNGIQLQYSSDSNEVYYNLIYGSGYDGIWLGTGDGADDNTVYNNSMYNNGVCGIHVGLNSSGNTIKNNIIHQADITWVECMEIRDSTVAQAQTFDNNSFYSPGDNSSPVHIGIGDIYLSLAEWQAYAGSPDAHSMNSDPLFIDAANDNFHLKMASSCVDKGKDVSLTQDYDGNTVPNGWAVDIGAYEYQGSVSPFSAEINASPTSGYVPLAVSFTGSASGGTTPYSYSWDFGDGNSSTDQNPSHTYSSAGTYTVTLTVTDSSSNQATDSLIITATSPTSALSASCSASTTSGEAPLTVNFTGSASGGTSPYTYSWNFGDGSSSSSQNPAHTYYSAGNYTVTLTVTDSQSSTATDSLTINVQEKTSSLQASASASPTSGQVPLTVSFTGSASGGTAPYSYSWNFGDGASSTAQNPSHTYSSAGSYNVTLTVTDSKTTQASASITITAQTQISALAASCTASPTSGDIPLTVNFTGTAAGGISPYSYSWNFGDGQSSSSQNPAHTYSSAGNYIVILTVTDSTASQATASTEVTASSPVHEVTVPNTPEGPSTGAPGVSYTYTTGGASCSQGHSVEYYFDWGDGIYSSWSSSTSASHIWSAAGTYTVKVQARCSVNLGVTSLWSEAKTVSLEESPNFQLYISSATDSPAPGQGGSTNPDTGTYPYPAGNTAQATALPAANYRFSKWTGDISGSDSYNSEITFNMDQDKSISALFCTQCGDVNGDLSITPADAQDAFEMFLGIISNATETQKENADVNCDGTATEPNITPADAQAIFEKFLGISELPGDCSCRSRADASSTAFTQNNRSQTASLEIQSGTPNIQLTIDDIDARFKREITIPVRINNPFNIKSFGFDLIFESGTLEFAGIEIGSLLNGFTMVDANEISEGVVRVGGFSSEPIMTSSSSVLVRLKFRVSGRVKEPSALSITNTVDDIKNAATSSGVVFYKEINDKIMRNKNVF